MTSLCPPVVFYDRKYYSRYSGYLGPGLQRLAECLYNTGLTQEAATVIQA